MGRECALRITTAGVNITTSGTSSGTTLPVNAAGTIRYVRVSVTANAHVKVGNGAQTATTADAMITPSESIVLDVTNCTHIAAIQNAAAGTVNIVPVEM